MLAAIALVTYFRQEVTANSVLLTTELLKSLLPTGKLAIWVWVTGPAIAPRPDFNHCLLYPLRSAKPHKTFIQAPRSTPNFGRILPQNG
ncbi:MAG: hypothetical protein KME47_22610 [Nodosilinea sp. WJT8-NPBG4]|nr:hypothetical protein [Nodosilinea sp. WJT8-NPBG4]